MRDWFSTISPDVIAKAADRAAPGSPCPETLTNPAGFVTTASGERDRCSRDAPYDRRWELAAPRSRSADFAAGKKEHAKRVTLFPHTIVVQRRTMHQHHWRETSVIAAAQFVLQLFR
jgi:hypothetical protein